MPFWSRPRFIIGMLCVCVFLAAGSAYAYLYFNARRIFNEQVSALTECQVRARIVRAVFPAGLLVQDLSIDGLLTCERARVTLDWASLLSRHIRVRTLELDTPVLVWEKTLSKPAGAPTANDLQAAVPSGRSSWRTSVILTQALIHNGVLKVVVKDDAGHESAVHVIDHIELRADNVPLTPRPQRTEFFIRCSLAKLNLPFVGHLLKIQGALNWAARDMDAQAQTIGDDGRVGLDVKLVSRQNDMVVMGTIKFAGDQPPEATGSKGGMIENVTLSALLSTRTDVQAGFSFKTKMDDLRVEKIHMSGLVTTGLNDPLSSGNIVAGLKAVEDELLKENSLSNMPVEKPGAVSK